MPFYRHRIGICPNNKGYGNRNLCRRRRADYRSIDRSERYIRCTVTDLDGAFSLNVPGDAKTLTISYVGMIAQDVAVRPTLSITLQSDTRNLEEIVVVGYGTQRKKDVTSSISQVRGQDIADKA